MARLKARVNSLKRAVTVIQSLPLGNAPICDARHAGRKIVTAITVIGSAFRY